MAVSAPESEQPLEQLAHLRRIARHREAARFHDFQFGIGRVGTAGNQRAGVTHAFAGRRGDAGGDGGADGAVQPDDGADAAAAPQHGGGERDRAGGRDAAVPGAGYDDAPADDGLRPTDVG